MTLMPSISEVELRTILGGLQLGETSLNLRDKGLSPSSMKTLADAMPSMATISEVKLSSNPMIGSLTGFRDKRDGSMVVAVAVKEGVLATTDGSRWGKVTEIFSDGDVKLTWLDDGSESGWTKPNTLAAVSDKGGLIEHAEGVFGGIEALCSGLPSTSIRRLELSNIGLTPAGLVRFASLFTSDTLFAAAIREVNVMNNPDIDVEHNLDLFEQMCRMLLKIDPARLQISGIGIGPNALKRMFSLFASDSKLTAALSLVNLFDNKISSDDINILERVAPRLSSLAFSSGFLLVDKNKPIENLDLSNSNLAPTDINILVTTLTETTMFTGAIISLNVMNNPIGDEGLVALMTAVKGTNIKTITDITEGQTSIDYSGQGLTPMYLKTLAADIGFTPFRATVRELNLSANPIIGAKNLTIQTSSMKISTRP
jgi:hypothetical protein